METSNSYGYIELRSRRRGGLRRLKTAGEIMATAVETKFKVGDRVTIARKPEGAEEIKQAGWIDRSMDVTVGMSGKVTRAAMTNVYTVLLDNGDDWEYIGECLKPGPLPIMFKIGNRVKIVRGPENQDERTLSGWSVDNKSMDATIGKVGVVDRASEQNRTRVVTTDPARTFSYGNFLLERHFENDDQVLITRKPTEEELELIGWNERMEKYTGENGVIADYDDYLRAYQVQFSDEAFWYPWQVLDDYVEVFKTGDLVKVLREPTSHEYRLLGSLEVARTHVGKSGEVILVVPGSNSGSHEAVVKLVFDKQDIWYPQQCVAKVSTLKKAEKAEAKAKEKKPEEKVAVGDIVEVFREPSAKEAENVGGSRAGVKRNLGKLGEIVSMYAATDLRVPTVKVRIPGEDSDLYCAEACVRKASKWKTKKYKEEN